MRQLSIWTEPTLADKVATNISLPYRL